MRHKTLLLALLLTGFSAVAAAQDIIVTKQSERIDAKILEVSPSEIKYKKASNPDGPTFILPRSKVASVVYMDGEVESFGDESESSTGGTSQGSNGTVVHNHLYRGLEFSINAGANIFNSSIGFAAGFQGGVSIGRRLNKNMYIGLTADYIPDAETLPVYATVRSYLPLGNSPMEFTTDVSLGYIIEGDAFILQAVPGLQIPLANMMDMRIGAGLLTLFGNGTAVMSTVQASLGFHTTTDPLAPRPVTLHNGLQIGFEGGLSPSSEEEQYFSGFAVGWSAGAIASYKFGPRLSAGVGFDIAEVTYTLTETMTETYRTMARQEQLEVRYDFNNSYTRYYLRGQYRFLDKTFSPFVALDLGLHRWKRFDEGGTVFVLSPAAGLSLRLGANSYIELKAQYNYGTSSPKLEDIQEGDGYYWTTYSDRSIDISHFFVKLGFTQTLNILSDRKYSDAMRERLKMGAAAD